MTGTIFTIIQYSSISFLFLLYMLQGVKIFSEDKKKEMKRSVLKQAKAKSRQGNNPHVTVGRLETASSEDR